MLIAHEVNEMKEEPQVKKRFREKLDALERDFDLLLQHSERLAETITDQKDYVEKKAQENELLRRQHKEWEKKWGTVSELFELEKRGR